jgi:hypothetical protein
MDLTNIKSVVTSELLEKNSLTSLKIQNHIYGCFLIMEDIAQKKVDFMNNIITGQKFILDLDKQFSEIGIRYGFVLDTKLTLDTFDKSYKDTWLKYFNDIDVESNIEQVDAIEDCLIEVIQKTVSADNAFFISALETGSLPHEWINKVITLLSSQSPNESDDDKKTAISEAKTEKPLNTSKHRKLATTKRSNVKVITSSNKKLLSKTRRNHK